MGIDIYRFGVKGDSSREFDVLAPHKFIPSDVSRMINKFGKDPKVREEINNLMKNEKKAEIVMWPDPDGEVIGISFPDSDKKKSLFYIAAKRILDLF